MKSRKLLVGVFAVVMLWATAMGAHEPVPGPNFNGCKAMNDGSTPYAPLPNFQINPTPFTPYGPIVSWPVGTYDFCACMDTIYCSLAPLGSIDVRILEFAELVMCGGTDLNGPLTELVVPFTGNGLLDGQYELAILAAVLNDPSHPLHAEATAAFQYNVWEAKAIIMQALYNYSLKHVDKALLESQYGVKLDSDDKNILPIINSMAPHLPKALSMLLAGYAVFGDDQTYAMLDELLDLLSVTLGVTPPPGGIISITQSVPELGPDGDADGDGFSNRLEYNWFVLIQGYSPAEYVAAALDPNLPYQQGSGKQGSGTLLGAGYREAGSTIVLEIVLENADPYSYTWYRFGQELPGQEDDRLVIQEAQTSDSGYYTCVVQLLPTSGKVDDPMLPLFEVRFSAWVFVGEQLPSAGLFSLAMLAGACALAGAFHARRRKA